jgi:hypothetical protein
MNFLLMQAQNLQLPGTLLLILKPHFELELLLKNCLKLIQMEKVVRARKLVIP